jgi:precorrin isomerase
MTRLVCRRQATANIVYAHELRFLIEALIDKEGHSDQQMQLLHRVITMCAASCIASAVRLTHSASRVMSSATTACDAVPGLKYTSRPDNSSLYSVSHTSNR